MIFIFIRIKLHASVDDDRDVRLIMTVTTKFLYTISNNIDDDNNTRLRIAWCPPKSSTGDNPPSDFINCNGTLERYSSNPL